MAESLVIQGVYAGGKVGRHMATLMVWSDDEEMAGGIMDAASKQTHQLNKMLFKKLKLKCKRKQLRKRSM